MDLSLLVSGHACTLVFGREKKIKRIKNPCEILAIFLLGRVDELGDSSNLIEFLLFCFLFFFNYQKCKMEIFMMESKMDIRWET